MIRRHLLPSTLALSLLATGLLLSAGCDAGTETDDTADESTFEVAGFALSADDESDDDFTPDRDPQALIDALDEEGMDDPFDDDGEVPGEGEVDPDDDMAEGPDRVARTVLIAWGQPTFNPDFGEPSTWRGKIGSNVANVRALRKLRFEDNDTLVRDDDPKTISISTVTGPHHDGVLLRVVAPRTAASLAGVLTFRTGKFQKTIPLADIFDGYQKAFRADDQGNILLVTTVQEHRCGHGVLRMRWQRKNARGGVFGGKYYGAHGAVEGRLVGVWGRVDGKRRFKGFFMDADRNYRGTIRGAYAPLPDEAGRDGGVFRGVWKVAGGDVKGVLGGMYRVGEVRGSGVAHGFWRAACADRPDDGACQVDDALPAPAPADCSCERDEENGFDGACECTVRPEDTCVDAEPTESATTE